MHWPRRERWRGVARARRALQNMTGLREQGTEGLVALEALAEFARLLEGESRSAHAGPNHKRPTPRRRLS